MRLSPFMILFPMFPIKRMTPEGVPLKLDRVSEYIGTLPSTKDQLF